MFMTERVAKQYARREHVIAILPMPFAESVRRFTETVKERLRRLEVIAETLPLYDEINPGRPDGVQTKMVFIIHGHDRHAALELQRLLEEKADVDAVLMDQKPGQGRTLIEKFEEEGAKCGYAIALLTPDDIVQANDGEAYAQMRPNVVFEVGWFCGRFGRNRVCILLRQPLILPSDLNGIQYYEFTTSPRQCWAELDDELKLAGLLPSDQK